MYRRVASTKPLPRCWTHKIGFTTQTFVAVRRLNMAKWSTLTSLYSPLLLQATPKDWLRPAEIYVNDNGNETVRHN